jgi:hypothetical protein
MGNGRPMEKVKLIGAILLFAYAIMFFYTNVIEGQTLRDNPIVSEEKVTLAPDSSINIVQKDEYQRIVTNQTERIQQLENRIIVLEFKIADLEEKIKGD